jgi:serine/threonine-protein kinase
MPLRMPDDVARGPVGSTVAGRYDILDVIGSGGQGLVCRGRDRESGTDVAIKILSGDAASDPEAIARFARERDVLVALSRSNVVRVLDTVCEYRTLYLVMELLDGQDLEQLLQTVEARGERLSPAHIARILEPIVDTLDAAHARGIVHRDLKPANVFVLKSGGVRLLDFGMARLVTAGPLTALGTVMGSPSYIAPEAWQGRPDLVGPSADIYSLGVILFRMLSGRLPFSNEAITDQLVQVTTAPRPSLQHLRPDLPPEIDAWAQQALAIRPEDRFRTVRAMFNGLAAAVEPLATRPSRGWLMRGWRALSAFVRGHRTDDAAAWAAMARRSAHDVSKRH